MEEEEEENPMRKQCNESERESDLVTESVGGFRERQREVIMAFVLCFVFG